MDADDDDYADSAVFLHHYRYLVVTPGAETDGGLGRFDSDSDMDDIKNLLNKTKISSGSLSALNNNTFTSNDGGGVWTAHVKAFKLFA